jgi:hypothetical protein
MIVGYSAGMDNQQHPEFLIRHYSDTEVLQLLDDLIVSYETAPEGQRLLDDWMARNPPPETPERFEGMRALVDYSRTKAGYEQRLEEMKERRNDFEKRYLEKAREVAMILPEGIPLIHDHRGRRYEIVREPAQEAGESRGSPPAPVSIRRLD